MQPDPKQSSGIYAIVRRDTNRAYIGATNKNFHHRWRMHKSCLSRGVHSNINLQWDWTFFGSDLFDFVILDSSSTRFWTSAHYVWLHELELRRMAEWAGPLYNIQRLVSRGIPEWRCPFTAQE